MATSTISNNINLIQTIARGITGVKLAPITFPNKLDRIELPYVLTFPEVATTNQQTFKQNYRITVRDYSVRCFIEPIGQNMISQRLDEAINLLQSFIEVFETNRHLQDDITIIDDIIDSGIISGENVLSRDLSKMVLAGQAYVGFVVTLRVRSHYEVV